MGSKIEDSTMLEPLGETVARISCIHHDGVRDTAVREAVAEMTSTGHPLCEPCVNGVLRLERGLRDDQPTDEPVSGEGEESTVKALWSFASDHVPCDGDVSIHVVEIDGDPYFALRCDPCNAVLKVRNEADYPVDFPPTPVSEVSPHLRPTDPTTHADARSEAKSLSETVSEAVEDVTERGASGATIRDHDRGVKIRVERLSDRHEDEGEG